jgi:HSP20 family protein
MSRFGTQLAPSRRIRSFTVADPFKELFDMQRNLNSLFESNFSKSGNEETALNTWTPAVDIYEDQEAFLLKLELPEMNKEDIKVNLNENVLSISGERRFENEDKRDGYHRVERSYGQFYRSFTLPPNVNAEAIHAEYKDGVLRLSLPKKEEARPKEISVNIK